MNIHNFIIFIIYICIGIIWGMFAVKQQRKRKNNIVSTGIINGVFWWFCIPLAIFIYFFKNKDVFK